MAKIAVCGGGSAGCVVAARLSEDPENEVILFEAGADYPDVESLPDDVRDAWNFGGFDHDWMWVAEDKLLPLDRDNETYSSEAGTIHAYRGKVIGGSSSVNATNALRPTRQDYERWAGMGNDWWTWDRVLPAFRALEDDPIGGPRHGDAGPLPVRRFGLDEMRPIFKAFLEACGKSGWPLVDDLNGTDHGGAGPTPFNQVDRVRQSTAVTYLNPARRRPNLTVVGRALVDRVELDGRAARRVVLADGATHDVDIVVLAAGSLASPGILMRSGIGPVDLLRDLDIPLVRPAEQVGKNLRDHGMVYSTFGLDQNAGPPGPPIQAALVFNAAGAAAQAAGCEPDLHIIPVTPTPDVLILSVGVVQPHSVGSYEIVSRDPSAAPRILLNVLTHPEDLGRVIAGIRTARELVTLPPLTEFVTEEIWPGPEVETEEQLAAAVLGGKNTYSHATSTCAMGIEGLGVVDQRGAVHGVEDLFVIDASIFPMIPSSPTNLPTIMLAERCAEALRSRLVGRPDETTVTS